MIAVHRSVREAGATPTLRAAQFGRDGTSA